MSARKAWLEEQDAATFEHFAELARRRPGLVAINNGRGYWLVRGGPLTVHYWPFAKRGPTVFVQGTRRAWFKRSPERVVALAAGEESLPCIHRKERRRERWSASHTRRVRSRLLRRYLFCEWCGVKLTTKTATLEHFIPVERGGTNNRDNLRLACGPCNARRGSNMRPTLEPVRDFSWPRLKTGGRSSASSASPGHRSRGRRRCSTTSANDFPHERRESSHPRATRVVATPGVARTRYDKENKSMWSKKKQESLPPNSEEVKRMTPTEESEHAHAGRVMDRLDAVAEALLPKGTEPVWEIAATEIEMRLHAITKILLAPEGAFMVPVSTSRLEVGEDGPRVDVSVCQVTL